MKYLLSPLLLSGPDLEHRQSVRGLQAQFAVNRFGRLDRSKRNLQPKLAAKKNFARLQERLTLRNFLSKPRRAFQFASHGSLSDPRLFAKFFRQRLQISFHRARLAENEPRHKPKERVRDIPVFRDTQSRTVSDRSDFKGPCPAKRQLRIGDPRDQSLRRNQFNRFHRKLSRAGYFQMSRQAVAVR